MTGIEFKEVDFAYGKKTVLDDLSLEISGNKLTCLLGSTGCGKTTILRLIAGLEAPKSGELFIDGQLVADGSAIHIRSPQRQVGMIFQDLALWPHFTVYKNIAWGLKLKKVTNIEDQVFNMLDLFDIRSLSDRYPHQLSGGQKQLVALGRALILDPKILLLDEPLSNLDTKRKKAVMQHILDLKQQFDMTLIYVTHDHRDAEVLADEIVVLTESGEIAVSGGKEEVMRSEVFKGEFGI